MTKSLNKPLFRTTPLNGFASNSDAFFVLQEKDNVVEYISIVENAGIDLVPILIKFKTWTRHNGRTFNMTYIK